MEAPSAEPVVRFDSQEMREDTRRLFHSVLQVDCLQHVRDNSARHQELSVLSGMGAPEYHPTGFLSPCPHTTKVLTEIAETFLRRAFETERNEFASTSQFARKRSYNESLFGDKRPAEELVYKRFCRQSASNSYNDQYSEPHPVNPRTFSRMLEGSFRVSHERALAAQQQEQAARDWISAQNPAPNGSDDAAHDATLAARSGDHEEYAREHLAFLEFVDQQEYERHRSDPDWWPLSPRTLQQQHEEDHEEWLPHLRREAHLYRMMFDPDEARERSVSPPMMERLAPYVDGNSPTPDSQQDNTANDGAYDLDMGNRDPNFANVPDHRDPGQASDNDPVEDDYSDNSPISGDSVDGNAD